MGSPPRMRGRVKVTVCQRFRAGITPAYAGKRSVKDLGAGGLWDHPRVCGEKLNKAIKLKHAGGSPPRMRGRVMRCSICQRGSGITPAYAGKRLPLSLSLIPCRDHPRVCGEESSGNHLPPLGQDHPRVCGEKFTQSATKTTIPGSPPRMRGKVFNGEGVMLATRITPAYAGKSWKCGPTCTLFWDHPRVCGEKYQAGEAARQSQGSPPRMRGKGGLILLLRQLIGITPAYAGKSGCGLLSVFQTQDHPCVCGEKPCRCRYPVQPSGSPPRMRGKAASEGVTRNGSGITPAYAGKSAMFQRSGAVSRDHPRVCGEKFAISSVPAVMLGSPPRMRGKAHTGGMWVHASRITPAYAGKRSGWQAVQPRPRDHPRVCGEKSIVAPSSGPCTGSPPRMRGKAHR